MKRHKILSWVLSLVMALTVFSIPVGSVYAEPEPVPTDFALGNWSDDGNDLIPITQTEVDYNTINSFLTICGQFEDGQWQDFYLEDFEIVWKNYNSDVAKLGYWEDDGSGGGDLVVPPAVGSVQEFQMSGGVELLPQAPGTVNLEVQISQNGSVLKTIHLAIHVADTDLPQFRLAISKWNEKIDDCEYFPVEGTVDFSAIGDENSLCVLTDEFKEDGDEWQFCSLENRTMIWHNDSTDLVTVKYNDNVADDVVPCDSAEFKAHEVYLVPKAAGDAQFSVDIYNGTDNDAVIVEQIPLTVTISQEDVDKAKYKPYLDWFDMAWSADQEDQGIWGEVPNISEYNREMSGEAPAITEEDFAKLQIKATIGGKTYNAVLGKDSKYEFYINIGKHALGTKVAVTYTMGTYTKTENLVVSKWVQPKVTVKNYVYNGKYQKAAVTVKVGNTTLKKGTDYVVVSKSLKNVGRAYYEVYNPSDQKNKYKFYKEGYFKVNPRGTYLKKVKKAKKAFTAVWAKQPAKMATSRITGYQIQYSTSSAFTKKTTKTVFVKGYSTTSKKIKKLKKKKTYYVRVRTYKTVNKVNYYSAWSKRMSVKTK